ncbi:hypothetical protein C8R47DRAFT_1244324 [Mycena vitilis]|nr:hypothetical protein C8R47DRAFT_1244324 [Mycena vitilis]
MSTSSRTMSAAASKPEEETDVTPRINSSMFTAFMARRVRVAGQLLKIMETSLTMAASDGQPVSILVPPDNRKTGSMEIGKKYEILGRVISKESIVLERCIYLGDADMRLIDDVVMLTHDKRFMHMFGL